MNIDFKLMACLAREEETALEKATLELQPATLGKNGGCHVVAQILKEMFPQYRIVSTTAKGDGMPPHVGCAIGKNFIDIEGIHPLPDDALDCEPVAESNPIYRGYLMKPRFLAEARTRLEPYVRSRIALYEAKEEGAANQAAEAIRTAVTPPAYAGDRASGARGSP